MFSKTPISKMRLSGFLDKIFEFPTNFERIFSKAIAFLVLVLFALGVILTIIGAIKWATSWDEREGKKTIVKGIVLIALSLLGGGTVLTISSFT